MMTNFDAHFAMMKTLNFPKQKEILFIQFVLT